MDVQEIKVGASVLRRTAKKSPLELLSSLKEKNPTAEKSALWKKWKSIIETDPEHLDAIVEYAFTNFWEQTEPKRRNRLTEEERAERQARIEERANSIVAQIVFMDLIMPNGKALGKCTGFELVFIGGRYATLGKQVGKKTVEEVRSEADLQKHFEIG